MLPAVVIATIVLLLSLASDARALWYDNSQRWANRFAVALNNTAGAALEQYQVRIGASDSAQPRTESSVIRGASPISAQKLAHRPRHRDHPRPPAARAEARPDGMVASCQAFWPSERNTP
jgi:hypothetical protein